MSPKAFSCLLRPDFPCRHVKSEKIVGVMERCYSCVQHANFLREMGDEDQKFNDESEEMQKLYQAYLRGELTEAELRRHYFSGGVLR